MSQKVVSNQERIAALIRAGRIRKGWNQATLAQHAGVSRSTLIHLERGTIQDPHAATLAKLAQALELSPEQFLPSAAWTPTAPPSSARAAAFDRATNPALQAAAELYPDRFADLSPAEWDELASQFGVGGGLTVEGALAAADRLRADRETLDKLRVLLQTHLREPARQVIEALYRAVEVVPRTVAANAFSEHNTWH
jgi:transcriptional regulator with XRE-family HTH domain